VILFTAKDLTGQRFGKLTVIERDATITKGRAFWRVRCECGTITSKNGKYLSCGDTRSCGCDQRAYRATGNVKHGAARIGRLTPAYISWRDAKERCSNPRKRTYALYGGRGIRMCNEWLNDFGAFLHHMGERPEGHSLDRIDGNGHYEPGNCRWATQREQMNNVRQNKMIEFDGLTMTVAEAARHLGVPYMPLYDHVVRRGKSVAEAVELINHAASLNSSNSD